MDPVTMGMLGAAGIGAVSDIANSFVSTAQSKKLMQKQFHYQKKMWQMENEYNKPINQMARLEEAGLNPNLVYSSGANALGGSMGSVSQPSAAGLDLNPLGDMANYQSIMNMMSQEKQTISATKNANELTKADLEIKEQQALNLQHQRAQMDIGTLYNMEQLLAQKIANAGSMMDLYQDSRLGGPRVSKAILQNLQKQYEFDNMPLTRSESYSGGLFGVNGSYSHSGQYFR